MLALMLFAFYIFLLINTIESSEEPVPLCDNPGIHSADRLVNGSVRLYRDNYYWELKGLPDREGFIFGPIKVWYKNFGPIHPNTSVVTCIECNRKGFIYKFEGLKWWSWEPSGRQWKGDRDGQLFKYLTNETGFDAVFHNGDSKDPMIIGIVGSKVFYYSTKGYYIEPAHHYDRDGYEGGKDGENFPTNITAVFSWSTDNKDDGYQVYIFREDKYCFRTKKLKSGQQCDQWRDNRELFGCNKLSNKRSQNDAKAADGPTEVGPQNSASLSPAGPSKELNALPSESAIDSDDVSTTEIEPKEGKDSASSTSIPSILAITISIQLFV